MTEAASALALGGITFLLAVIWGGPLIRIMRTLNIGEQMKQRLKEYKVFHLVKRME